MPKLPLSNFTTRTQACQRGAVASVSSCWWHLRECGPV